MDVGKVEGIDSNRMKWLWDHMDSAPHVTYSTYYRDKGYEMEKCPEAKNHDVTDKEWEMGMVMWKLKNEFK